MAASTGNDGSANDRAAAEAFLSIALVNAVAPLKTAEISVRVHVVRNRRSPQPNRIVEHLANGPVQTPQFIRREPRAEPHGMDSRAPQAFVSVDVSNAPQHMLIEQQRLDSRAPVLQQSDELRFRCFQRIESERAENFLGRGVLQKTYAAESASIRVAQFAAVIERKENVSMLRDGFGGIAGNESPRHAEVDEQGRAMRVSVRRFEIEQEEFSVSPNRRDSCAGNLLLDDRGVIDEIRFSEAHSRDAPSGQYSAETASDCLNFRKFRHGSLRRKPPQTVGIHSSRVSNFRI